MAPTALEQLRIAGNKYIVPDLLTKTDIAASGKDQVIGSFKLCIDVAGNVVAVKQLKSTGFAAYDAKLEAGIRQWKYRPFAPNGKPTAVCTAATFIYTQKDAPPPPPPTPADRR